MKRNKAELFIKLAQARTRKAAKTIQLIGNLSNKANYQYTDEQVQKIFSYIQTELDKAKRRFELVAMNKRAFSLSDEKEVEGRINSPKNGRFLDGSGEENICPVCGGEDLEFIYKEADNTEGIYPWKCTDCGAEGEEHFTVTFDGHYNKN